MRRLYQKIYLTMIGALLLLVLIAGAAWRFGPGGPPVGQAFELIGELAAVALPPAEATPAVQAEALRQLAGRLRLDLALFDSGRRSIATIGHPLPPPNPDRDSGVRYGPGGPAWVFRLPDDRWLVARPPPRHRSPVVALMAALAVVAVVVAVAAFPVVRGLTRRLETLQAGVETLGAGHLAARVPVEGRDEVARLAESFNRAAGRIEELVGAHRLLLANASHELRTPLARIRLGIELMRARPDDDRHAADLARDIAELDGLIDEILLASRLDAIAAPPAAEEVDLLALAAEECARFDGTLDGEPVTLTGDSRLLRRMIRNLLENAARYGAPPVRVGLRAEAGRAVLTVADGGPGIPAGQREQVFAPFFRLAGDGRGAGLGLALVRQIARLHGGDAVVAPQPGVPSCFRVDLPLARGGPEPSRADAPTLARGGRT